MLSNSNVLNFPPPQVQPTVRFALGGADGGAKAVCILVSARRFMVSSTHRNQAVFQWISHRKFGVAMEPRLSDANYSMKEGRCATQPIVY